MGEDDVDARLDLSVASEGGTPTAPGRMRVRRVLARPWPRPLLVAVTAVATFAMTAVVVHANAGEVPVPAPSEERAKPSRASRGPAGDHDLRVEAQAALPTGADMYVAVVDSGDAVYDDMPPGEYLMDIACAAREEAATAVLRVTVLPSGRAIPVEVVAGDGPVAISVSVTEDGGLRTSPVDLGGAVCQFSLRRR